MYPGVRDEAVLESASGRPLTSLGVTFKYCTPYDAAAALGHWIITSHPFRDGNKRTALLAMIAMLDRDHLGVTASDRESVSLMLGVAKHKLYGASERTTRCRFRGRGNGRLA